MRTMAMLVGVLAFALCAADASAQCLGGKCGTKSVTRSRTVTRSTGGAVGIYLPQRLAAAPEATPRAEQVPTPAPATAAPATAAAPRAEQGPATTSAPRAVSKSVLKSRTKSRATATPVPIYWQPVWCAPPPVVWVPAYPCCPR